MTVENEIQQLEALLLKAMLTSDVVMLNRLLSDDLLFTDHRGRIISKTLDLKAHAEKSLSIDNITASEEKITVIDDVAIVSVLMKITGIYADKPFSGMNRYLRVWKQTAGEWKVIAGQATTLQM